jgi:hypothetical protein
MSSTKLTQTKISDTYGGVLHSNGEALPVSTLVDIFDGVGNKSSLKLGRACNGATVCGPLTCDSLITPSLSCTSIQIVDKLSIINIIYPVGSVYFSVNSINPSTIFTGTTWMQISQGRYIAGVGTTTGEVSNSTTTFNLSTNSGTFVHAISTASHTHGIGRFSESGDDKGFFIYEDWAAGDGSTYSMRRIDGSNNASWLSNQTGAPFGMKTSTPVANSNISYNINTRSPSFGLYVWQRLT